MCRVQAEDEPPGAEGDPKALELAGSARAGRVEGGSRRQAARQQWPERWPGQRPPRLQRTRRTDTACLKVSLFIFQRAVTIATINQLTNQNPASHITLSVSSTWHSFTELLIIFILISSLRYCCCFFGLAAVGHPSIFTLCGARPRGHVLPSGQGLHPGLRRSAPPTWQLTCPPRRLQERQSPGRPCWWTVAETPCGGWVAVILRCGSSWFMTLPFARGKEPVTRPGSHCEVLVLRLKPKSHLRLIEL